MNQKYTDIYNEARYQYRGTYYERPFAYERSREFGERLQWLERVILDTADRSKVALRADAKLFLLTNFHQMILIPLSHPLASEFKDEQLKEMIAADVQTIIKESLDDSTAKSTEGISGGAVLRTTAKVWGNLKTNATKIWT